MTATWLAQNSPQGLVRLQDSIGTAHPPYDYTLNLAHVTCVTRKPGSNRVFIAAAGFDTWLDLSDADAAQLTIWMSQGAT